MAKKKRDKPSTARVLLGYMITAVFTGYVGFHAGLHTGGVTSSADSAAAHHSVKGIGAAMSRLGHTAVGVNGTHGMHAPHGVSEGPGMKKMMDTLTELTKQLEQSQGEVMRLKHAARGSTSAAASGADSECPPPTPCECEPCEPVPAAVQAAVEAPPTASRGGSEECEEELESVERDLQSCQEAGAAVSGAGAGVSAGGSSIQMGRGQLAAGTFWSDLHAVDGLRLQETVLSHFPPRKPQSPKGAFVLTHAPAIGKANPKNVNATLDRALAQCDEVTVALTRNEKKMCLAVLEVHHSPMYNLIRMERSKNPKGTPWVPVSRYTTNRDLILPPLEGQKLGKFTPENLLHDAMNNRGKIEAELKPILERLDPYKKKGIIILAVNSGVLDLVVNFLCSCKSAGIKPDTLLVFAGDTGVKKAMESMGVATFYSKHLGDFPSTTSRSYGDNTFTQMMWLKVTSVYFTVRLGWDAMFQDADVVWWKDPRPWFQSEPNQYDTYWQDDGARSARYTPFSANTGFYYIRSNKRTQHFMHELFQSFNLISQWRSHQHVLNMLLIDHHSRFGTGVKILDQELFSIGQMFHRRKPFMRDLVRDKFQQSILFHWSWTAGKVEKLKYSKETGMWYLKDSCDEKAINKNAGKPSFLEGCCREKDPSHTFLNFDEKWTEPEWMDEAWLPPAQRERLAKAKGKK